MWRFVHLTDMHLGSVADGLWNNRFLCTMMPEVVSCLRRDLARLQPDFLLVTGDIFSQQTRDAVYAARDLMDSLGFPYFPCGGNHDFVGADSRDWFAEAFQMHLPGGDTVYSFTHKNLHFCVLDPWWKRQDGTLSPVSECSPESLMDIASSGARWGVPPHQLAWLEDDLGAHRSTATIVAVHYPLIPIPQRLHRAQMKDAGHLDDGELVLEVLRRHPQVKAVLSGHVHMHFVERLDGLVHVTTGSMPEFPTEYRDVQVYDDRLEVHTCGLSDASFAARSLIPGNDWTAGTPGDRTAVVTF